MYFVILTTDKPDSGGIRAANREEHIAYLESHTDRLRLAGATPKPDGDGVTGSFLLIEADSLEEAKAWAENDPFHKAGVFQDVEIRPWNFVLGSGLAK